MEALRRLGLKGTAWASKLDLTLQNHPSFKK
jgi:hypothetical protein